MARRRPKSVERGSRVVAEGRREGSGDGGNGRERQGQRQGPTRLKPHERGARQRLELYGWDCPHCEGLNFADKYVCGRCGAQREDEGFQGYSEQAAKGK